MHLRQSLTDKERAIHDETGALFSILGNAGALEDYEAHEKVEERYLDQINTMQGHIQTLSRRAVKERYGSGPYKVAIDLQVWDHISTIVVENLDITKMPDAIHMFLDMLTEKVSEGATMTNNQRELTVSVPLSPDNDNRINEIHKRTLAFRRNFLVPEQVFLVFQGSRTHATHFLTRINRGHLLRNRYRQPGDATRSTSSSFSSHDHAFAVSDLSCSTIWLTLNNIIHRHEIMSRTILYVWYYMQTLLNQNLRTNV
jgi:hypothetical protein